MAYFTGATGPVDYEALQTIRDIILDTEPLVVRHDLDLRRVRRDLAEDDVSVRKCTRHSK